jgi:hypothetical protein
LKSQNDTTAWFGVGAIAINSFTARGLIAGYKYEYAIAINSFTARGLIAGYKYEYCQIDGYLTDL